MQFHLPNAGSFLRLHAPDQHGDDLSKFRPLVVAVNTDRVAPKGLVVARTGPANFGVVPMVDPTGGHTDSLDVGMGRAAAGPGHCHRLAAGGHGLIAS